jgi:hypothetical protein
MFRSAHLQGQGPGGGRIGGSADRRFWPVADRVTIAVRCGGSRPRVSCVTRRQRLVSAGWWSAP